MSPGTPAAKIPDWRTRIRGAWLIKIGDLVISSLADATQALQTLVHDGSPSTVLLFAHPEIRPNLSHNGLPIVSSAPFTQHIHDQMNNRWEFTTVAEYLRSSAPSYQQVDSGGVLNIVNRVLPFVFLSSDSISLIDRSCRRSFLVSRRYDDSYAYKFGERVGGKRSGQSRCSYSSVDSRIAIRIVTKEFLPIDSAW